MLERLTLAAPLVLAAMMAVPSTASAEEVLVQEGRGIAGVGLGMAWANAMDSVGGVLWYEESADVKHFAIPGAGGLRVRFEDGLVAELTAYPVTFSTDSYVASGTGVMTGAELIAGDPHYSVESTSELELRAAVPGVKKLAEPVDFGIASNMAIYAQYRLKIGSRATYYTFVDVSFFTGYTTPADVSRVLEITVVIEP